LLRCRIAPRCLFLFYLWRFASYAHVLETLTRSGSARALRDSKAIDSLILFGIANAWVYQQHLRLTPGMQENTWNVREEEALRVIPRGKQRLTVYRAHHFRHFCLFDDVFGLFTCSVVVVQESVFQRNTRVIEQDT